MSGDEDRVKQGSGKQVEGLTGSEWLPIEAPTEAEIEAEIYSVLDGLTKRSRERTAVAGWERRTWKGLDDEH
jgi:hypothetical protein